MEILTEHHGRIAGSASMYVEEAGPEGKVPGSSIPFDWAAKPGELHASPSFSCGKLSRIEVMVSVKPANQTIRVGAVSYTHLDVYKRQSLRLQRYPEQGNPA